MIFLASFGNFPPRIDFGGLWKFDIRGAAATPDALMRRCSIDHRDLKLSAFGPI
jgi:hypothetical protein